MQSHFLARAAVIVVAGTITVVDGDSIYVDGVEWRLLGCDTPEIGKAKCEAERRLGLVAKHRLEKWLRAAKTVETKDSGKREKYGRPLGSLILDGHDTCDRMIEEGMARKYGGEWRDTWLRGRVEILMPARVVIH